ncbi:hypothetical protein [Pseudobdellovibrio exovorus]|uniref:AB hydrolase-1 domain-containing protein n=1 Tax=Pseudobdellovibrio exovorus JSS TaxID=1184267 RepID=M4VA46_9BACT|nr:hypothetical protein [Pseudobdellovibrio exovorus]AGH94896.1 hypothetical protein A11Q_676 [Pseudobdellovibrio exovorus JSS]
MQSQVKIICCLAFIVMQLFSGMIYANNETNNENSANQVHESKSVSELNWQTLNSKTMEIGPYTSGQGEVLTSPIPFFRELGTYFWSWDPKVGLKQAKATYHNSEEKLKKETESIYLEPMSPLNEIMRNLFVQFDLSDTSHFRKVWFRITPFVQFRGLFAVHDFTKKRPLIILRMGIHGNVDEVMAERFLMRLLYEELDANVLVLESSTSSGFLSKNKDVSFGGIDEGLQTFLVINELKKTGMMDIVQSFHLVGLSLGGHGTFVTALLDQHNGQNISSIVNLCPLINLQQTFTYQTLPGWKNAFADFWNAGRLQVLLSSYAAEHSVQQRWKTLLDFKPRFTVALLDLLNRERKRPLIPTTEMERLIPSLKWPEGLREHLEQSNSFFELNDFWQHYQGVKTPMMIYTTPNDELVINTLNGELIFNGIQEGDFSHLKYTRLERSIHCGLASVYHWDYIAKLLKDGLYLH